MVDKACDIKSIMFDLDGTLIDSVPVYYGYMESILKIVGLPPAPKSVVAEFMTGNLEAWEKIIPEQLKNRKDELIHECMTVGRKLSRNMFRDDVELFEGVHELFSLLAERNILIGLVTSTERINIERKLDPLVRNGLRDHLDVIIAIEDAPKMKPAPDPLLECARRIGVPPKQCIYVGDSHVDIRAGNAAEMMTIGVLTGLDDYETLSKESPTMIMETVFEIRKLLF